MLREACSIVQLLMMIVMMACPSLIRNSTPLIKGPGAPVLMAAGPSPESDSRRGEARRHPWHTPVDRATKQKRVTLAPPPPVPLSSPWVPQTRPILLPSHPSAPSPSHPSSQPQKPQHTLVLLLNTHTHIHTPLLPFPLSFTINFTNQLISLFLTHPPGVALIAFSSHPHPTSCITSPLHHQLLRKVEIHHCV